MTEWQKIWSRNLYRFYFVLSAISLFCIILFWIIGPIAIAKIFGLVLFWTIFGCFINSVH